MHELCPFIRSVNNGCLGSTCAMFDTDAKCCAILSIAKNTAKNNAPMPAPAPNACDNCQNFEPYDDEDDEDYRSGTREHPWVKLRERISVGLRDNPDMPFTYQMATVVGTFNSADIRVKTDNNELHDLQMNQYHKLWRIGTAENEDFDQEYRTIGG